MERAPVTRPQTSTEPTKDQKELRLASEPAAGSAGSEPTARGVVEGRQPVSEGVGEGLRFERYYTRPGVDPFDEVEWETRDAIIANEKGETVFEQRGVEIPNL